MVPLNLNLSAPSTATSSAANAARLGFDGSGWTLSTGGGTARGGSSGGLTQTGGFGAPAQQPDSQVGGYFETVPTFGAGVPSQAGGGPLMWLLLLGAAGFLILR